MLSFVSLLQILTCGPHSPFLIKADLSDEIPTVIQIQVQSPIDASVSVEAKSGTRVWRTEESIQQESQFVVVGMPPEEQITLNFEFRTRDQTWTHTEQITTGSLPPLVQQMQLSVVDFGQIDGYFFGTIFSASQLYLVLFDTEGTILWAIKHGDSEYGGIDSVIAPDGQSFYYNLFRKSSTSTEGKIVQRDWSGRVLQEIDTPQAHHLFTLLPDSSLAYIARDKRDTEDHGPVCGDSVIHRSIDGQEKVLFRTWDHLDLYETASWNFGFYSDCIDWTHGNFLEFNGERDSYLLSLAGPDVVLELSSTGEILRYFTGVHSRENVWDFNPPEDRFSYPHGIHWGRDDSLMMISTVEDHSVAVAYRLNEEDNTLETQWKWGEEKGYNVLHLGEVIDYEQDIRLVNWGSSGHLQLLNATDEVIWEATTPLDQWFAQFSYLPTLPNLR